jgi:hypothetical protein
MLMEKHLFNTWISHAEAVMNRIEGLYYNGTCQLYEVYVQGS